MADKVFTLLVESPGTVLKLFKMLTLFPREWNRPLREQLETHIEQELEANPNQDRLNI